MDLLQVGQVIHDRYRLERCIGEGGMGVVWSAQHCVTEKRVALKILKAPGDEVRRRFLREARLATALRHPNIVDVHDVFELEDGQPCMVMDLLTGQPLSGLLDERGSLGIDEVVRFLLPMLSAVGAAHAQGVVHRDLKPDNIFLASTDAGELSVKVLDFGIAKLTSLAQSMTHMTELTHTGSVLGTPTYMAPEQVFGEKSIDHRADIWTLGVILYECLAGKCPIEGENVGQIFKSISQRAFPPLGVAAPKVPVEAALLVDRMLSLDPAKRPSLAEVAVVFAELAGVPAPVIVSPAITHDDEAPLSRDDVVQRSVANTVAAPLSPRRSRIAWLVGLGLAGAVAVTTLSLSRRPDASPRALVSAKRLAQIHSPAPVSGQPSEPTPSASGATGVDPPANSPKASSAGATFPQPALRPLASASPQTEKAALSSSATKAPPALGGIRVQSPYN